MEAFDAENIANLRQTHEQSAKDIADIDAKLKEATSDEERASLTAAREKLESKQKWLLRQLERLESSLSED